jgi:hypothetical protein
VQENVEVASCNNLRHFVANIPNSSFIIATPFLVMQRPTLPVYFRSAFNILRPEFGVNDISKINVYLTEARMSLLQTPVNEYCLVIGDNHIRN